MPVTRIPNQSRYHIMLIIDCNLARVGEVTVYSGGTYQSTMDAMSTIRKQAKAARMAAFFEKEFPDCIISFQVRVG